MLVETICQEAIEQANLQNAKVLNRLFNRLDYLAVVENIRLQDEKEANRRIKSTAGIGTRWKDLTPEQESLLYEYTRCKIKLHKVKKEQREGQGDDVYFSYLKDCAHNARIRFYESLKTNTNGGKHG